MLDRPAARRCGFESWALGRARARAADRGPGGEGELPAGGVARLVMDLDGDDDDDTMLRQKADGPHQA